MPLWTMMLSCACRHEVDDAGRRVLRQRGIHGATETDVRCPHLAKASGLSESAGDLDLVHNTKDTDAASDKKSVRALAIPESLH